MAGRVNYKIVFNLVLTVILIGILGFNYQQEKLTREDIVNTQGRPPAIGSLVPEFYVTDANGKKVRFQDLQEWTAMIVFWNIGCQPSVRFLEALCELDFADSPVQVMPVSVVDSLDAVRAFYEQRGWDFPIYVDADRSTKWAFKVTITPSFYLINNEGKIVYRQLGSSQQGFDYVANWVGSY
ncbi:MAG TPA: TlpA disulfide reductase family protein [Limnochordia bacterium]|nr:TlpA disulfide reductase family protein [Limnochordia bacterium]